jgi:hypothetical protein
MPKNLILFILFAIFEILLAFLFSAIAQIFYKKIGIDFRSIFKGVIERLFLTIALINDLTSALTFFSALKLATRLKHQETGIEHNKFNDYYLVGNLASVTVAIFYMYIFKNFDAIPLLHKLTQ